jgi:hypothetical protein
MILGAMLHQAARESSGDPGDGTVGCTLFAPIELINDVV